MQALVADNFVFAVPEIFLAISALFFLVLGAFRGDSYGDKLAVLTIAALLMSGWLILDSRAAYGVAFSGMFSHSLFTVVMKMLVIIGAVLALFMALPVIRKNNKAPFEYSVLLLLATIGLMLMISANDLLALYMGLEMASLALYVLAASDRDSERSAEAGVKYFVLGALASGMLLYGCSLVYGFTGTTSFTELATIFAPGNSVSMGAVVGLVFILVGMSFKISAVPFHMWTPDVYEGSPTQVTAFFAMAPKVAAVALLVRLMSGPFGSLVVEWQQIIIFVSAASMAVGAFAALRQTNIKRLLAYSSIGHVGYILMGVAAHSIEGVQGVVIYLSLYIFMSAGAFACVMLMRRKGVAVENIDDLKGLSSQHPRMAFAMAVFMFSMAGIPPLAGFFGKLMVFLAALKAGLMALAIIGVLTSVVAAYYYIRIVKIMYFDAVENPLDKHQLIEERLLLAGCSLVTLLFFLYPTPLFNLARDAARSLGLDS